MDKSAGLSICFPESISNESDDQPDPEKAIKEKRDHGLRLEFRILYRGVVTIGFNGRIR